MFKVGDKVDSKLGNHGTIVKVYGFAVYEVQWTDGSKSKKSGGSLVLSASSVSAQAPVIAAQFKVGDRVKYLGGNCLDISKDSIYSINAISVSSNFLYVTNDMGHLSWYPVSCFASVSHTASIPDIGLVKIPAQLDTEHVCTMTEKHKCNCEFRSLLMNGCKCGGI